jgi:hypothetical protein
MVGDAAFFRFSEQSPGGRMPFAHGSVPRGATVRGRGGDPHTSDADSARRPGVAQGYLDHYLGHIQGAQEHAGASGHGQLTIESHALLAPPDGAPRNRTTVGVGEKVQLVGSEAGLWSTSGGTPGTDEVANLFLWQAPDVAGACEIRLTAGRQMATRTMNVVKPDGLAFRVEGVNDLYFPGEAGAAMWCRFRMQPTNVSFGALWWREQPNGPSAVSGYFLTGGGDKQHHPRLRSVPIGEDNDFAWPPPFGDHAAVGPLVPPWREGHFEWRIPNVYSVGQQGTEHPFMTTVQAFHMTGASGQVRVTKQGAQVERTPPRDRDDATLPGGELEEIPEGMEIPRPQQDPPQQEVDEQAAEDRAEAAEAAH